MITRGLPWSRRPLRVAGLALLTLAGLVATSACSDDGGTAPASSGTAASTSAAPTTTTTPATTTTAFTSPVARATVRGPVSGGKGAIVLAPSPPQAGKPAAVIDMKELGYTETEFFVSGTATAYTSAVALAADGAWKVTEAGTAP